MDDDWKKGQWNLSEGSCWGERQVPYKHKISGLLAKLHPRKPKLRPYWPSLSCLTPDRGADNEKPAIFLIGDSHARMYLTALQQASSGYFSVNTLARPYNECFGLPYNPEFVKAKAYSSYDRKECERIYAKISSELRSSDIIIVHYASYLWWKGHYAGFPPWAAHAAFANYTKLVMRYQLLAAKRNASTLLFGDPATLRGAARDCIPSRLDPHAEARCAHEKESAMKIGEPARKSLAAMAKDNKGMYFFDVQDLFCDDQSCGIFIPGTRTLAFLDDNHFTDEASYYMWPFLCDFMRRKGLLRGDVSVE